MTSFVKRHIAALRVLICLRTQADQRWTFDVQVLTQNLNLNGHT